MLRCAEHVRRPSDWAFAGSEVASSMCASMSIPAISAKRCPSTAPTSSRRRPLSITTLETDNQIGGQAQAGLIGPGRGRRAR